MVRTEYVPDRGDIVWLDFNPSLGDKQAGRRPALVISPQTYNERAWLALVCPITSKIKGYPYEVLIETKNILGAVLVDQLRTIDWKARRVRFISQAQPEVIEEVQAKILTLVD